MSDEKEAKMKWYQRTQDEIDNAVYLQDLEIKYRHKLLSEFERTDERNARFDKHCEFMRELMSENNAILRGIVEAINGKHPR